MVISPSKWLIRKGKSPLAPPEGPGKATGSGIVDDRYFPSQPASLAQRCQAAKAFRFALTGWV